MPRPAAFAFVIAILLSLFSAPVWAAAGTGGAGKGISNLASHRAIHKLKLDRARQSSGITDLRGRLVMEWADACSGYTLNQRMVMETQDSNGGVSVSDFRFSTWESRDGLSFRYNLRHEIDGNVVDEVIGRASLDEAGKEGRAEFKHPDVEDLDLPAGTVFPSEHTARVVAAALGGAKRLAVKIFDGSGPDGLFDTTAVIGPRQPPEEAQKELATVFGPKASWSMRLAFFNPDNSDGLPEYEMTVRMYENGVIGDLLLDYNDFSIKGELEKVEEVDGGCS
jgi:hypothetical protein